mgnify:CR=1 FL=1
MKKSNRQIEKFTKMSESNILKIYIVFHVIIAMYSIAVSIKCNQRISPVSIGIAIACPHLYLIIIAATKGISFCFLNGDDEDDDDDE